MQNKIRTKLRPKLNVVNKTSILETIRKPPIAEAKLHLENKTQISVPLPKFYEKLLSHTKFHLNWAIGC